MFLSLHYFLGAQVALVPRLWRFAFSAYFGQRPVGIRGCLREDQEKP
jgi:hypothetical protein